MSKNQILILGVTGMLGHKMLQELSRSYACWGTIRGNIKSIQNHPTLKDKNLIGDMDILNPDKVKKVINDVKPNYIINCIGIVKQLPLANDAIQSITVNSLFPHILSKTCEGKGIQIIHYSTDCVFSGNKGNYSEDDIPDPIDLYGKSKLLGEITYSHCLTLRTSIIGREIGSPHSLLEWFLSNQGNSVKGFKNVLFSGLTTNMHATIVKKIIQNHSDINGLYHLGSDPISKFDLLSLFNEHYDTNIEIIPDYEIKCDRSLNSSKFRQMTNIKIPSWDRMIREMSIEQIYNN